MIPFCAILLTLGVADAVVTMPLVVHRPTRLQEFHKFSAKRASRVASGYGFKEVQQSMPMGDKLDQEYVVEVQVGTPPQKFVLLLETGSDYFWVPSVRCDNRSSVLGAGHYYDNSSSSTWHSCPELGRFSSRNFYNGTYAKDTVIMAGFTIDPLTFGEVTERFAEPFENVPFDGMLGLSPVSFSGNVKNPIYTLFSQGKIKSNLFGIYLDGSEGNASSLTLGGTQRSLYTEDLYWIPLHIYYTMGLYPYWIAQGEDVKVNGRSTNYCGSTGCLLEFDTGGWGLAFSPTAEGGRGDMVMNMIGRVTRNCSNVDSMQPVTLTMNGKDFTLGPEYYIIRGIDPETGKSGCQMYAYDLDEGGPDDGFKSIGVGDAFFRKYYSVWDYDRSRVGFASAKVPESLGKPIDDVLDPVMDFFVTHPGGQMPSKSLQTDTEMLFM